MPEPVESVTIAEEMRGLVAEQAARRGMESIEDYIDYLIQMDLLQNRREEIETKLLEAIQSPAAEMTKADWDELRRQVWERHAARSAS